MERNRDSVKLIAFCCPGRYQHYFLHRLNEQHELLAVVLCEASDGDDSSWARLRHLSTYLNPAKAYKYLVARLLLGKYEAAAERRLGANYVEFYKRQTMPPGLHTLSVDDINDPRVLQCVERLKPELICVNGTNLIREPLLSRASKLKYGIINLHTGLSPYARGGNCNLFMLLENQPQLVGATVHRIDKGIDSGKILRTLRPAMAKDDPFEYIDAMTFIDGFNALLECIAAIQAGVATEVAQWEEGKLFLRRTGYEYEPFQRLLVNKMIEKGMLEKYLLNKVEIDAQTRLIG